MDIEGQVQINSQDRKVTSSNPVHRITVSGWMKYGGNIRSNSANRESPPGPAAASGRGNTNHGNGRKPAWGYAY